MARAGTRHVRCSFPRVDDKWDRLVIPSPGPPLGPLFRPPDGTAHARNAHSPIDRFHPLAIRRPRARQHSTRGTHESRELHDPAKRANGHDRAHAAAAPLLPALPWP